MVLSHHGRLMIVMSSMSLTLLSLIANPALRGTSELLRAVRGVAWLQCNSATVNLMSDLSGATLSPSPMLWFPSNILANW